MLLPYQSSEFLNHGFQCGLFHGFPDGILNLVVWSFQHFADILCHRAGAVFAGMNPDQRGDPFGLQGAVYLVQRDLRRIGAQLGSAGPSGHRNKPRFFQRAENIADHNGIAAGAFRQKVAGHFGNAIRFVDEYQAVNRNGAFYTDLHVIVLHPFKINSRSFIFVVTIDFTSFE